MSEASLISYQGFLTRPQAPGPSGEGETLYSEILSSGETPCTVVRLSLAKL